MSYYPVNRELTLEELEKWWNAVIATKRSYYTISGLTIDEEDDGYTSKW
jgi:hypothetical protein